MKIYLSKNDDIYKNKALDEALLFHKEIDENILFISQNKKNIVVGRNQNIYELINHDFIEKKGITITRRISGGGAIYQDDGTISFSLIMSNKGKMMSESLKPMIQFLIGIGLNAKIVNNKGIYVNDKKICHITEYHYEDNVLYYGTLLFNSDLNMLLKSLTKDEHLHQTRLTNRKNNTVANIKELLDSNWTTKTFMIQLINYYQKLGHKLYKPSKKMLEFAHKIWLRTSSWEWIYGPSPDFKSKIKKILPGGALEIRHTSENGKIKRIKIFGDFESLKDTSKIEAALKDVSFKRNSILKALSKFKSNHYFGKIAKKDIVNAIIDGEEIKDI